MMDINQLLSDNLFKHTLSTIFRIVNFQMKPDNNYFGHGSRQKNIVLMLTDVTMKPVKINVILKPNKLHK